MKKIVIAVDTYFPKKDGVVRFLENVVPRLAKKYFITILAPNFNSGSKYFESGNVNEILFPVNEKRAAAGYNPVLKTRRLKKIMLREIRNCDLVFSQDIAYLGRLAVRYGRKLGKQVISYVHQISWEQIGEIFSDNPVKRIFSSSLVKFVAKGIYKKCSLLFVPSRTTAEQLKMAGIHNEKAVIHLGVDLEKFSPAKNKSSAKINARIDPSKYVVGYCGRISEEKDLLTLRDAFVMVKEKFPDSVLLIVGDGSGEDAEKLKKTQDIIVTGFVKDVSPYLKAMDIFVLPSLTETTSLATMEAMACGIPVITTPVGRLSEYVQNNANGYIFPPRNSEYLAKKIETLLSEPRKRLSMGNNARNSISRFSWEFTVQRMVEMFENLTR
jgi:glycosyltransferase involved in cell wall biosynthesis